MHYPYIPNSSEAVRKEMLDFVGVKSVEEIYSFIPESLRMKQPMNIPEAMPSEQALKKYMNRILDQNRTCEENLNFLGAGCYDHYVPAICDEINGRSEFVTAYSGDTYADHGKLQIFFEYASMMGELLNLDVVNFPTYDGGQAASTAVMMAHRINGRKKALVPASMNPALLLQMKNYCEGIDIETVAWGADGRIDTEDLKKKLSDDVACVFLQNPSFLGFFEEEARQIGEEAHAAGAEFIVYADPSSLGVIAPPADYGADITCGDIQPLGIHMSYGAGLGGYLATRQEERYIMNFPHHLHNIFKNSKGEFGFARALPERTSYYVREKAVEYLGTCNGLWTITAAVYLALMGPEGMRELGENILYKSAYAQKKLSGLKGVRLPFAASRSFMEFVLDLNGTGKTVEEVNKALLTKGIFGGFDLSRDMPSLGQSMLVCVTEKTEPGDIDTLCRALEEIL